MAKVSVKCQACGTSFLKFPKDAKRASYHFCSDECKKTPCVPVTCVQCGQEFFSTATGYSMAKFCSSECRNAHGRKKWTKNKGATVTKKCIQCGKSFSVRASLKDKQEFCSLDCFHKSRRIVRVGPDNHKWKPKTTIKCDHCGKLFKTYPSRKDRRRYCSKKCQIVGNLNRLAKGKRTGIEKKMANALTKARIRYKEQSIMFNKFVVDFELIDHRIIVQCDGIYWHERPDAKRRDKGQDRYLAKAGYIVLRFSDEQIDNDISDCIRQIKRTIKTKQMPLIHY